VGSPGGPPSQGLTPRCKKIIELALAETHRLGHHYVGTEHLLLGLLREGDGVAARVLTGSGLDLRRLYTEVTAALGGEVQVPTLNGPVKYRIPEGTQPGTEFRLKGEGIQMLRSSGKGDLIMKVKVEIPKRLNNRQKEILREFDGTTGDREYENRKSFMDRVKDLFN
jgi:ATP-dependent Clp protease ATP-binding subunit ClpA